MKLILIISAIVVFILGISIGMFLIFKAKSMQKKLIKEYDSKIQEDIIKIREKYGELPAHLSELFPCKIDKLDVEFMIQTICRNNYEKTLIISDELYSFATAQEVTKKSLYYIPEFFDGSKWNEVINSNDKDIINFKPIKYNEENLDLIIVFKDIDPYSIYKKMYSKLNKNGMIIIKFSKTNKQEFTLLENELYNNGIPHEFSFVKTKYLFIRKD